MKTASVKPGWPKWFRFLIAFIAALFVLVFLDWLWQAVPAVPAREDATRVRGIVRKISADTRRKDIQFLVSTGGKRYLHYINRGLGGGVDTNELKATIGKEVDIWYYTGGPHILAHGANRVIYASWRWMGK